MMIGAEVKLPVSVSESVDAESIPAWSSRLADDFKVRTVVPGIKLRPEMSVKVMVKVSSAKETVDQTPL